VLDFKAFLSAVKDGVKGLITRTLAEHGEAAGKDANAFLEKTRADLERWTKQLADGALTKDDFAFLVKGKADLAEMEALKQAGLALVRVDQFRKSVFDLVVGTATKMFVKV